MTQPNSSNSSPSPSSSPQDEAKSSNPKRSALAAYRALGYSKVPYSAPLLRGKPQSAAKALNNSPILTHLLELSRDSEQRLYAVKSLLPTQFRDAVKSSTLDGENWCLLVPNNSVMAKLKQMLPSLAAHLRSKGYKVQTIRLKIEGT